MGAAVPAVVVRPALDHEYATVGRICVEAYRADGFLDNDDDYAATLADAADRAVHAELLVAELDGHLAGTVTFCPPGSTYRELAHDHEGEFRMLAVDPAYRGRGIARALVGACFDRAAARGLETMVLCSLPTMSTAHALYGSMGFIRDAGLDFSPVPDVVLYGFRAQIG